MKKLTLIMLAVISMALVSCGGGAKQVNPRGTKFAYGQIARLVEVVDEPATFDNGQLKVKLVKVNDYCKGWDTRNIDFYRFFDVLSVDLEDSNGNKVGEGELRESDHMPFKEFLTKEKGTVGEFVFDCRPDSGKSLDDVSTFTPHSTANIDDDWED